MHPSTAGLEVWFRPVCSHVLLIARLVILTLTNEKVASEQNRLFENSFPVWSTLWWGVRVHPPTVKLCLFSVFSTMGVTFTTWLLCVCVLLCFWWHSFQGPQIKRVLIHTCLLSTLWLLAVGPHSVSSLCSWFYTDCQSQSISLLMAALSDPETFLNVRRCRCCV